MQKTIDNLKAITDNLYKQGKSDQVIKTIIKAHLRQAKQKFLEEVTQ